MSVASRHTAEPTFFDPPAEPSPREVRDRGADLAANSVHTGWRLAAEAAIARLAATGRTFSVEDVRAAVGAPPGHHNSLGGLFIAAAKRRQIVAVGYRPSTRVEAHARPVRTWRGLL